LRTHSPITSARHPQPQFASRCLQKNRDRDEQLPLCQEQGSWAPPNTKVPMLSKLRCRLRHNTAQMNIEQCARELANLLQSGRPPSAHQVSSLINSCLRGSGARQMDLKRHELAVAFKGMVPESEHRNLILRRILPDDQLIASCLRVRPCARHIHQDRDGRSLSRSSWLEFFTQSARAVWLASMLFH
jgi:hypothetical protein